MLKYYSHSKNSIKITPREREIILYLLSKQLIKIKDEY